MSIEAKIVAFEGGKLRALESGETSREAVLALPLNRLLVKLVHVPSDKDPAEVSEAALKAASPFPDETLTVGCELVREDEGGKVVLAAALPESAADDIGEALDAEKLSVVRIDSLALGQLRGIWKALGESSGRRMVLLRSADCLSLFVLDGDQPTAVRAITDMTNLRREMMLSLLEAEDFGGAKKLEEIVLVESESVADDAAGAEADDAEADDAISLPSPAAGVDKVALSAFAPVRSLTVGADAALVGVQERSADEGTLNALPESWREVLEETRFKAKLVRRLAVAGGLWLLVMAVLFGVPVAYGFMTDGQKDLMRQHARQYQSVKEMKEKVAVVRKYSDHARGALEIMKALSDRLPEGVTLSSWTYRREEGVRVTGETAVKDETYALKDTLEAMSSGEGEDAERIFNKVDLSGVSAVKGMFRFTLDCLYQKEEEE